MASSIFGNQTPKQSSGFSKIVRAMFDNAYSTNPKFREFADSVQGKSPQQVCQEYNLDFDDTRNQVSNFFNKM